MFKRLGFAVSKLDCERVINAEPGACARCSCMCALCRKLTCNSGTIEQVLKALKFRIERALDVPSETPEPGGGGYNSRQSQSDRPAEPAAPPAPPYVSYTPSAPVAQARAELQHLTPRCYASDAPGSHGRPHRHRHAAHLCPEPRPPRWLSETR